MPMTNGDIDDPCPPVALFDTEEEAAEAGRTNIMGEAYGYEVYDWDFRPAVLATPEPPPRRARRKKF